MRIRRLVLACAVVCAATATWAGLALWKAAKAARSAAAAVEGARTASFAWRRLDGALPAIEPVGSPSGFRDVAFFGGDLFVATPDAVVEYDSGGEIRKRWRAGLELPPAALTTLAVGTAGGGKVLWAGTDGAGLLMFDGHGFQQMNPADAAARKITALLPLETGRLLVGTAGRGVLTFDGKVLAPFDTGLAGLRVTALAGDAASLWVGSADRGLYHWQAGALTHFGEAEGLPDANVTSMLTADGSTFAGGPMGIAEFREGRLYRTLARGFFTSALVLDGDTLLAGSLDEGVASIPLSAHTPRLTQAAARQPDGAVERLVKTPDAVLAVTRSGLYARVGQGKSWREVTKAEPSKLADRNVSALMMDAAGRLWVGYFDRGLDVVDGERVSHFESDTLFCINRIVEKAADRTTAVATANGLAVFDDRPAERQVLKRSQGLIADDVTDVVFRGGAMTVATPAGITLVDESGTHSVSDFHGLVNQHVYALAQDGDELLAGTLGGLSVLQRGVVQASYTTFNSHLRHNWITAIRRVGDDWFVGTYGAGVLRFTRDGDWDAFADLRGAVVINPNAMLVTQSRVYAGTMQGGLAIYDRLTARWHFATNGLPSLNVTALAMGGGTVYVGTDNGLVRAAEENLR